MTWLDAFWTLLRSSIGMFLILSIWILIQRFVRHSSGCQNPDKDVLDFMLNGCGSSCSSKGLCHSDPKRETK